ncbi:hypothetical protein CAPI_09135 [Corynebacterium capitovis DSM 44611]|uniref:hypothetical protein n=1 Tax=Corynebacterium capitovis TaxID=131081 RepID=UPI0003611CCA|nr:hypothetical protein [Corynebacterium capitovis]WKD58350.1 hypothetical protein CAPI_09135 [Corynebacterium capitovis DSM 44611]
MHDHPENDLHSAADYSNRARPEPVDFDELADQPDPAEIARVNSRSTKQAVVYAIATVLITVLVGLVTAGAARVVGGPLCDADAATWLCTQRARTIWALINSVPPVVMLLGCAVIMVRKLNRYERWMPWMGVFWLPIVPFTMWWLTVTIGILAADSV